MNHARLAWCVALLLVAFGLVDSVSGDESSKPNIIVILADDLGYGDVRCLNPEGKIATPHLDRLASEGVAFTDAHSGSSVCTPTRYGLLTGRYAWRTKLQSSVLGGLSPRLIEPDRATLATLLKEQGYNTGCVGKWHLGMNWKLLPGKGVNELSIESPEQVHNVDYSAPIADGPNAVGFDYYFGISASLDMVPFCFIENDRVTALPTGDVDFPLYLGRPEGKTRTGPGAPGFTTEGVLPEITKKAVEYIDRSAEAARGGKPFFLYFPLNSPHTPVAPSKEWQGKSGLTYYADFVMQTDDTVGRIMQALEKHGLRKDTLIVVTSDNGCSPQANFPELKKLGHNPSSIYRGNKADVYDGGHRVPFIVSWPAGAKTGATSDQLVCLTDVFATCAEIVGAKVADDAGEDSFSFLHALAATPRAKDDTARKSIVHHSINGSFVVRDGRWKLAFCPDSGGWSNPRPGSAGVKELPPVQLFNMQDDPSETQNVQADHADVVERLTDLMATLVDEGRSTPGPKQRNAVVVDFQKPAQRAGKGVMKPNPMANNR
ncbi:MAG: arylsulfatase [Planctomycetaceae bacterium]|nr:arylsulfatase [Planctomycetaceae bacterium]